MSGDLFLLEPYSNKELFSFIKIPINEKTEWRLYIDGVLVIGNDIMHRLADSREYKTLSFEEFYNYIFKWAKLHD